MSEAHESAAGREDLHGLQARRGGRGDGEGSDGFLAGKARLFQPRQLQEDFRAKGVGQRLHRSRESFDRRA